MKKVILASVVLLTACHSDERPYSMTAFENVGVQPDADGPIIEDARQRLPALLQKCGIQDSALILGTDSAVTVTFSASRTQIDCLRRSVPPGATILKGKK